MFLISVLRCFQFISNSSDICDCTYCVFDRDQAT